MLGLGLNLQSMRRGGIFSPSKIEGMQIWYDASDEDSIIHSSNSVSQISDKSGNGNHATQVTPADRPTTKSTSKNGKNTLLFNNKAMVIPNLSITDNGTTTFFVFKPNNPEALNSYPIYLSIDGSSFDSNSRKPLIHGSQSSNSLTLQFGINNYSNPNYKDDNWVCVVMATNNTDTIVRKINNFQANSGAGLDPYNQSASVGELFKTDSYGEFAELITYNRFLSQSEIDKVHNHLMNKWGINPVDSYLVEGEDADTIGATWSIETEFGETHVTHGITKGGASPPGVGEPERMVVYNLPHLETGTYRLWVYGKLHEANSSWDSAFFRLNEEAWIDVNNLSTGAPNRPFESTHFQWYEVHNSTNLNDKIEFNLTEGYHTLTFGNRESLDIGKIYITKNGDTPS